MAEKPDKYANDPMLNICFSPADVRTHFDGAGLDDMLANVDDEALSQAAREIIWKDANLDEAVAHVFDVILYRASDIQTARRN